jgi:uncharacterized protein (TIGR02246 family)
MNKLLKIFTVIVILIVSVSLFALAKDSTDVAGIRRVIYSYQQALNDNNVEKIMKLFTEDVVVLIPKTPTNVGITEVRKFYEALFKSIDLDLEFQVAEVVQVSPEWAFVRSTTHGTVKIISDGSNNPSVGQELFILKKQTGGSWKIARYMGSPTN